MKAKPHGRLLGEVLGYWLLFWGSWGASTAHQRPSPPAVGRPTSQQFCAKSQQHTGLCPSRSHSHCSRPSRRRPAIWFPFLEKLVSLLDIFPSGLSKPPAKIPQHSRTSVASTRNERQSALPFAEGSTLTRTALARPGLPFLRAQTQCPQNAAPEEVTLSEWLFQRRKKFQLTGPRVLHSESPPWRGNLPFLLGQWCRLHSHPAVLGASCTTMTPWALEPGEALSSVT